MWREEKAVEWGEGIGVVSVGEITGRGDRNKKKVEREREEREIRGKGGQERREGEERVGRKVQKNRKKKETEKQKGPRALSPSLHTQARAEHACSARAWFCGIRALRNRKRRR